MAASRRREGESRHDFQHRLITERHAAARARRPRVGDQQRIQNRQAWTALAGHVRQVHGQRVSPRATYTEVAAWHDHDHATTEGER